MRMLFHLQRLPQQSRRIDISVAMYLPVAQKARILQPRNQPQHARLLAEFQVILEADQIVGIRSQIFLP